jgi:hypothetical protein
MNLERYMITTVTVRIPSDSDLVFFLGRITQVTANLSRTFTGWLEFAKTN